MDPVTKILPQQLIMALPGMAARESGAENFAQAPEAVAVLGQARKKCALFPSSPRLLLLCALALSALSLSKRALFPSSPRLLLLLCALALRSRSPRSRSLRSLPGPPRLLLPGASWGRSVIACSPFLARPVLLLELQLQRRVKLEFPTRTSRPAL